MDLITNKTLYNTTRSAPWNCCQSNKTPNWSIQQAIREFCRTWPRSLPTLSKDVP